MPANSDIKSISFKVKVGTACAALVFVIGLTVRIFSAYSAMSDRISSVEMKVDGYGEIEKRVGLIESNYVEIKTKLSNIETLLMEVREKIYK